ncbi:MAG: hypothetical protein IPP47_00305 [Bryobacterales bacterium]|nr:hypothetical protein [Bryobacterales bacterium]
MRFAHEPHPTPVGAPVLDAVPTSVRTYGDQLLVSLLTGFPFVPGNSRVMLVDPVTGTSQQFMFDLTSVTDVLWRPRPNARPQFFVLEFSANQSATPAPPGRLLRFDTENATVAAAPLITPVSLAFDEATQDLFILELRGQILRLHRIVERSRAGCRIRPVSLARRDAALDRANGAVAGCRRGRGALRPSSCGSV